MKIIIDIGHPAHVHLFRFFAEEMKSRGHQVLFTVREKEHETELLKRYNLPYETLGRHGKSLFGKIVSLGVSVMKAKKVAVKFSPDIFLSHGSIIAAMTSKLCGKPHISLEDTGNSEQVRIYLPFTDAVLTSEAFHKDYGKKQIRYKGFHELAYLNPLYFIPDSLFNSRLDIDDTLKLIIVRFVSWNATHDKLRDRLSDDEKIQIIEFLSGRGKVYISSEGSLPDSLKEYVYPLPPETMHQALYRADLFIGEGATMASECAVLGTPAIYINPQKAGTINVQAENGLIFQTSDYKSIIDRAEKILEMDDARGWFMSKRNDMLKDKIDLTAMLVWFFESWPESFASVRNDPEILDKFALKL